MGTWQQASQIRSNFREAVEKEQWEKALALLQEYVALTDDDEDAHRMEKNLWEAALSGHPVLASKQIQFSRWYA
jgi:hypothetical protein